MRTGKLIAMIAAFVLLGMPLVWYLWTVVNELLTGHLDGIRVLVAIPVLAVFLGLLAILARAVTRWDEPVR